MPLSIQFELAMLLYHTNTGINHGTQHELDTFYCTTHANLDPTLPHTELYREAVSLNQKGNSLTLVQKRIPLALSLK